MNNHAYKIPSVNPTDLFNLHASLVSKVARNIFRKYPGNDDVEDLKQCGYIGLLEAIQRYDTSYGIKFETYATIRIQGAILDAKRKDDWVPRSTRSRIKELKYTTTDLTAKLGRKPKIEEIAKEMGMSVAAFCKMSARLDDRKPLRLDQQDDDANSLSNMLASHDLNPEEQARKNLQYAKISSLQEKLPERDQKIIDWYYYEGRSFKEIALRLHLTESRISQIHSKICVKLRKSMS